MFIKHGLMKIFEDNSLHEKTLAILRRLASNYKSDNMLNQLRGR